ncbi:MAG: SAM-dependent methyltransferase, partial [Actinomycetota bacterium]
MSVNGRKIEKPGTPVAEADSIAVREIDSYVSRGGLKLEKAFAVLGLDVSVKVALDAGASTGGFTDCLLKKLARKV